MSNLKCNLNGHNKICQIGELQGPKTLLIGELQGPKTSSHRKPKEVIENDKRIKAIEDKLLEIEKKEMNSEESIILKKLEVCEKEFENKMKTFENNIVKLNAVIEEKDSKIDTFEKQAGNCRSPVDFQGISTRFDRD